VPGRGGGGGEAGDLHGKIPGPRAGVEFTRGDENFHGVMMGDGPNRSRTKRKTPPERGFSLKG
jgi:hypothetical protein